MLLFAHFTKSLIERADIGESVGRLAQWADLLLSAPLMHAITVEVVARVAG